MVFLCKFGQNPLIGAGNRVQTMLILTVFIVWWPWKLGQGHQNLIKSSNLLTIPKLQYIKFGQNQSFGSRDRVQTRVFWSKFDIQSAGVTLKMRSRSPNLITSFPNPSNVCASLVKIHPLVQKIESRQEATWTQTRMPTGSAPKAICPPLPSSWWGGT